jgi:hypothetical protein
VKFLQRMTLARLVFGQDFYSDDPLHLNDLEPALTDGPCRRRGDLFLSLRNVAAVILYRLSENRVVWLRQGPWANKLDVASVDDRHISVFNNNRMNRKLDSLSKAAMMS